MPRYIDDLSECDNPTAGDQLLISDASEVSTNRDKRVNVSKFALTQSANTFTAANTFSAGTTFSGGVLTSNINLTMEKIGPTITLRNPVDSTANSVAQITLTQADNGNSIGTRVILGRNTNSSKPASGHLRIETGNPTNPLLAIQHIWPDREGKLRIGLSAPIYDDDLSSGTRVGEQTSHESFKNVNGDASPISSVFSRLFSASLHVHQFFYFQSETKEQYEGLVLKENAPETHYYGTDKQEEGLSAGKSLNLINLCADLMRAVVNLNERVTALETQLSTQQVVEPQVITEQVTEEVVEEPTQDAVQE